MAPKAIVVVRRTVLSFRMAEAACQIWSGAAVMKCSSNGKRSALASFEAGVAANEASGSS
jgi:hypothetical protein